MSETITTLIQQYAKDEDSAIALQALFQNIIQADSSSKTLVDYEYLCGLMPQAIVLQDCDGRIIHHNPSLETTLRVSINQLPDNSYLDPDWQFFREDGTPFPLDEHPTTVTMQSGIEQQDVIMGILKPYETLFWVGITTRSVRDADGNDLKGVISIISDMTGHEQRDDQVLSIKMEQERIRILSDFVRDASHEFRTPLATIHTKLYLMVRNHEELADSRDVLEINRHLDRLNSLVDNLELLLKLEETSRWQLYSVKLSQVIESIIDNYQYTYAGRISINAERHNHRILANEQLVIMAIQQVLDNAIAFSPNQTDITVTLRQEEHLVAIEITDQGMGMSEDVLARVYDRFYRLNDAHIRRGFGLGLAIVKGIMEVHTNPVDITSQLGIGTTVTMSFNSLDVMPKRK